MGKVKVIIFVTFGLVFMALIGLEIYWRILGSGLSVLPIIYWMILAIWVIVAINKKLRSDNSFFWAFGFFVISAVFGIFGARFVSEIIMKISFIGWVIGIVQALMEYKKDQKSE